MRENSVEVRPVNPRIHVPDKVEWLTKEELVRKYIHLFSDKELKYLLEDDKTRGS